MLVEWTKEMKENRI